MKKLIFISVLVVLVVGIIVGGTVFAAKPTTPAATGVLIEADGGYAEVPIVDSGVSVSELVLNMPKPNHGHVSLTVMARNMDADDYVQVNVGFTGGDPGMGRWNYKLLDSCNRENGVGIANIEFDTGLSLAAQPGDVDCVWHIWVTNDASVSDDTIELWYNYTITYPGGKTENEQ